jgi:hypothetical protein
MRFSILAAVAAFSSVALGQSLDNLPQCAVGLDIYILGSLLITRRKHVLEATLEAVAQRTLRASAVATLSCQCLAACLPPALKQTSRVCSEAFVSSHQLNEPADTIQFASGICKLAGVDVNTSPTCASGTSTPSAGNGTASATPSGSASVSGVTGSASRTPSASAAASSGAAPQPSAGAGLSLGMAMAGLLAAL